MSEPIFTPQQESLVAAGTHLPVMEHFYTIQGEGAFSGVPAYFIRLGGCDVGCVWCDVKESWPAANHPLMAIEDIVALTQSNSAKTVVITGGEPLMYNLFPLTQALRKVGKRTHIETSGAYPMSGEWDWVCFSPKKFKAPHSTVYELANELKSIVFNKSDFEFAEQHARLVNKNCSLYLQPEWSKEKPMAELIVSYVKENPNWRISLQTHKYLNIP